VSLGVFFSKRRSFNKTARKQDRGSNEYAREASIFMAPKLLAFNDLANKEQLERDVETVTYVKPFTKMHHFYDTMCTDCGDFNYAKRFQTADVKGQIAIITGSRLKIGYHIINAFARSNRYCYDPFSGGFGLRFLRRMILWMASFKNSWI
jgi:hypothetical protein